MKNNIIKALLMFIAIVVLFNSKTVLAAPVHPAFHDDYFYTYCVIKSLNWKKINGISNRTESHLVTDDELIQLTNLNCPRSVENEKIVVYDISGLEKLTGLKEIYLTDHNLTSIDVSKNTKLQKLILSGNKLNSVDLSKNVVLTYVNLEGNNLSSIDVSKNTKLQELNISNNKFENIDLGKNVALASLDLYGNNLSSIDLSKNVALTVLRLGNNSLNTIDLKNNILLTNLSLHNNNLQSIDFSKNTLLEWVNIKGNGLAIIDLKNLSKLKGVGLGNHKFMILDRGLTKEISSSIIPQTISKGEQAYLETTISPPPHLIISSSFSSSDENVATIDNNGMITANNIGTVEMKTVFAFNNAMYVDMVFEQTITVKVVEKLPDNPNTETPINDNEIENPKTGDNMLLLGLGAIALVGIGIVSIRKIAKHN